MTALADSQAESQFVRVRRRFYATFPFYPVLVNHKEINTGASALSAAHSHAGSYAIDTPSRSLLKIPKGSKIHYYTKT
jgi:hypothetical protein